MTMSTKIKVLLAEDEETLSMIIKDTLEYLDFEIITASDGLKALDMYVKEKFDIVGY